MVVENSAYWVLVHLSYARFSPFFQTPHMGSFFVRSFYVVFECFDGAIVHAKFDGSSNYLGATDGTTTAPRTAFYVARFRGVPPSGKFYFIFNAGPWVTLGNNGNIATYVDSNTQYTSLSPGTGWHVFHLTAQAGSLVVGMDYQEVTITEAATTGMNFKAQAGGRSDSTAPLAPMDFAEHITFSGVLTAQQRAETVKALRAAYSI